MAAKGLGKVAEQAGRKAENSAVLDAAVRIGLVSFGVVHLLLAWVMIRLTLGARDAEVSQAGALNQLATQPFGRILLWVLGLGLVALVLWQLLDALVGHRDLVGLKRAGMRIVSFGRAVVYGLLAGSAVKIAVGAGGAGSGEQPETISTRLMEMPFGRVLVAGVGVVVLGYAVGLVCWALSSGFEKNLESRGVVGARGKAVMLFAKVGYPARAVGFLLVGLLFLWAALTRHPERSGGLDEALGRLLGEPFGPVALVVIAAGFACFGLYCFAWARHLDR